MNRRQFVNRLSAIAATPLLPVGMVKQAVALPTPQPWAAVAAAPMKPLGPPSQLALSGLKQSTKDLSEMIAKIEDCDSEAVNQVAPDCGDDTSKDSPNRHSEIAP